jgi:hypothetical protein
VYSTVKAMPNADASGQNGPQQQHRASRVGGQDRRRGLIGDGHAEDPGAVQSIGSSDPALGERSKVIAGVLEVFVRCAMLVKFAGKNNSVLGNCGLLRKSNRLPTVGKYCAC